MSIVLFVEDNPALNEGVTFALKKEGYQVVSCFDGETALMHLNKEISLAILDISLPGIDGFTVAKRMMTFHQIPILFLTAKDEETEMLKGYALGCEDYITKPFSLPVLLEKIKVVLRSRAKLDSTGKYYIGNLCLDFEKQFFQKDDEIIQFTAIEMKLLHVLITHKNQILSKEQLIEQIWGLEGEFVDNNTLSVNIRRLRIKIEDNPTQPERIKTVFGIGYKWCAV